ncbi:MAG: bacteriohemerythrin [Spirochaetota bacterium]
MAASARRLQLGAVISFVLAAAAIAAVVALLLTSSRPAPLQDPATLLGIGSLVLTVLASVLAVLAARVSSAAALARHEEQVRLDAQSEVRASTLRETVLESEGAGRKLAAQIGDTLAGVARIASEASRAHGSADALAEQVAQGASAMEEIQASVEALARQIANQNSLVDQSAAAIEEMSASIDSVAAVARTKQAAAINLADLTRSGTETVGASERLIDEVNERVGEVTGTIGVINAIAAQTNLLAMNAAIEAAHAGSYGRGFAVVASEIRSLAETTSKNATRISRILTELAQRIAAARDASTESGDAFRSIQVEAESVSAAFSEITSSTEELAGGTNEIVRATEQLRIISAETGTSSDEMRIGASEVAEILTATRETARETAEAMQMIEGAAQTVSSASSTISGHSIENNERVGKLIELLDRETIDGEAAGSNAASPRSGASEAIDRLTIANMILSHMAWIGNLRAYVDGNGEALSGIGSAAECSLGRWLRSDAERVIEELPVRERLDRAHDALHRSAQAIVALKDSGADARAIESQFAALLEDSRTVTEILSSYEERTFVWTSDLSVSVETFDLHHQRLFELVSRLYRSMRDGGSGAALESVFADLLDYTVYHFAAEERAFAEFGYPEARTHAERHAELVGMAKGLQADMKAGKPMVAVEVMQFLRDWITNHIQIDDKRYSTFLREKDVDRLLGSEKGEHHE